MTEAWRLVFRRCRFVLLLIFEFVHLAILIALLSYWGKENISVSGRNVERPASRPEMRAVDGLISIENNARQLEGE